MKNISIQFKLMLVESINKVGKLMGQSTIAEFVEDVEILNQLQIIGVDFAQGYGIGKPMPIEEFRSLCDTRTLVSV